MLLESRVACVTGSAGGIGKEVGEVFAREGARVVGFDREDGDVSSPADVERAIAGTVAQHGRIDIVVNCAGIREIGDVYSLQTDVWDNVLAVNLSGTFYVCQAAARRMRETGGGSIVNMTADYRNGFPTMVHTGAARAGMANLTMTLAYEWAVSGVRVNSVAPGWIASSGMDTYTGPLKEQIPKIKRHVPLRRPGT